ncbi:ty1-copia retrotransposon protein [Cucumis melo var. makuwa]|uniref:Ty1-copia retrotransposon protein n=1 Tax=Cucumis melo var. makuwa TaxID=1194695 RepID=A0A5D3CEE1_CUCMM|nr:ty1-copia retrotransposon protein [Cucumis melo var. makuwa]TYK09652.1 ty1-copia retrotransposon protein [Cucumis melo var. makuwa]
MRTEEANRLEDKKEWPNQRPIPQANLAEQDDVVIAAVVEVNLIKNKTDWILDTRASRHFFTNRELLHDYEDTTDRECVFIGNSTTVGVLGKGKVSLKIVLEGDKVILTKNGEFVAESIDMWHGKLGQIFIN